MDKKDAIKAMLDGKKARHNEWKNEQYILFDSSTFRTERNIIYTFSLATSDFDWEIYAEPKKKIKKTYWRAWYEDSGILHHTDFYDTKELDTLEEEDIVEWESKIIETEEN